MFERIKKERNESRLNRDVLKASLLTTLQGEIETISRRDGKEITDELCVKVIKSFIKGINEVLLLTFNDVMVKEKEILEALLPSQLTEDELTKIINEILRRPGTVTMGLVMNSLKQEYPGLYDGKLASCILKDLLNV